MTKIKSIPKADVEKLIKYVEQIQRTHKACYDESTFVAYGYASSAIPTLLKMLKGEFPIL